MKNLMNLKGAKMLRKIEQKAINGGYIYPDCDGPHQYHCTNSLGQTICCFDPNLP